MLSDVSDKDICLRKLSKTNHMLIMVKGFLIAQVNKSAQKNGAYA
jgi:hypothetical protein